MSTLHKHMPKLNTIEHTCQIKELKSLKDTLRLILRDKILLEGHERVY